MDATLIALIRLQPVSIQEIADRIGLAKTNLIAAMGNRRPLPERAKEKLLEAVGADATCALRNDVVHCWRVREPMELEAILPGLPAPTKAWVLESPVAMVTPEEAIVVLAGPASRPQNAVIAVLKAKLEVWNTLRIRHPDTFGAASIEISDPKPLWSPSIPRPAILFMIEQAMKSTSIAEPSWEEIITLAENKGITRGAIWNWLSRTQSS